MAIFNLKYGVALSELPNQMAISTNGIRVNLAPPWHLPAPWRRRGWRRGGLLFRCFIFVCILIEPVILSLRTALANWWYVCVICHTPVPRFYCVHKSHYHFYIVHNNVLQHGLCIWCYYVLLYFVRNDENKDDQSNQYPAGGPVWTIKSLAHAFNKWPLYRWHSSWVL